MQRMFSDKQFADETVSHLDSMSRRDFVSLAAVAAAGAGGLAGIGFTMSLFMAGEAFPAAPDFAAAKIAIFIVSLAAGMLGTAILWKKRSSHDATEESAVDEREVAATKI